MFKEKTKQGYPILAIVKRENSSLYDMIAHKPTEYNDEYVVGMGYDVTDGTWGNGHYVTTYESAKRILAERI